MPTPKQIQENIDNLYSQWEGQFTPLYSAVREMKRLMFIRIFEKRGGNKNTAGIKIPRPARRGGDYKGDYSPQYEAKKKKRPLPLELTGYLRNAFINIDVETAGLSCGIVLPPDEYAKAQGLQFGLDVNPRYKSFRGYGIIFQPTEQEQEEMLQDHAEQLVEQITNALKQQ
jgi:hypothetical protein